MLATLMQILHKHHRCLFVTKLLFFDVHVETAFVLTSTVQFTIRTLSSFKDFFAYTWLEIWGSLHTPEARWLAY
jgi:hypothetical protein